MNGTLTLDDLVDEPVWLAWQTERREDDPKVKPTKVPYSVLRGRGKADDPSTWGTQKEAKRRAKQLPMPFNQGGVSVVLGIDVDGTKLGGIDLDTCIDKNGDLADWARPIVGRFDSYTEISPSGAGLKIFFRYRQVDREKLQAAMGTAKHGRMFKRSASGNHPPAIELHLSNRFFTVTNEPFEDFPDELRLVGVKDLLWLLEEAGPAFAGNGHDQGHKRRHDQSRSAKAFRLAKKLRQQGKTYDQMVDALLDDPETADWVREKGEPNEERELKRVWENAAGEDSDLPQIEVQAGKRHEAADAGIAALVEAEVPFYQRGAQIVQVLRIPAKASDGRTIMVPGIEAVPAALLMRELGKAAVWLKFDGRSNELRRINPPADVATQIMAMSNEWPFLPLLGVISTQTMRPGGSILDQPGYDEATGLVLFEPPPMEAIPDKPTKKQARAALELLDELLEEFPFAGDKDASRSVALSMLMTPVLRGAIGPAVPLHVVKAPSPGTGKSLLADLSSAIATGEVCPVISRAPSIEETEKRLHSAALSGQAIILIDNCNGELRSEFLCQAIERPLLQVRPLGESTLARIGNTTTCFANGNNIEIAEDLVRRSIQCSLDADMERPELREFKHDPLKAVLADRGKHVAAILTIARAYVAAGMPQKPHPFMSFGLWSDIVTGSLMWLGCADPCETVTDLAMADPVRDVRAELFRVMARELPAEIATNGMLVRSILRDADENIVLRDTLIRIAGDKDKNLDAERFGKWLRTSANKIAGGYKLVPRRTGKRTYWALSKVGG